MAVISEIKNRAEVTINLGIEDAPPVKARYMDREFLPDWVTLTYRQLVKDGRIEWVCRSAKSSGSRILKPGPDGSMRLGKDTHSAGWSTYLSEDITNPENDPNHPTPEWLVDVIDHVRPSGFVQLPVSA